MSLRDTAAVGLTSLPEFRGPRPLNPPRQARTSAATGMRACLVTDRHTAITSRLLCRSETAHRRPFAVPL
jgi:hypothetical protein